MVEKSEIIFSDNGSPVDIGQILTGNEFHEPEGRAFSRLRAISVIFTLSGINFLNTMGSGILIAALPQIASDVDISDSLILWPAAVYSLAAGCLLPIFASVADILGAKLVWLTGSMLFVLFTTALGFATTALQTILLRTCLGLAMAMCLPTTVSLITNTFPKGKWRTTCFAMNGMAQPLGYALGLVLGGVFTDSVGWRWAYWIMAILNACVCVMAVWALPNVEHPAAKSVIRRIGEDVDWVGVVGLSASLGIIMYILAMVTSDFRNISSPSIIALLVLSLLILVSSVRYFPQIIIGTFINIALIPLLPRVHVAILAASSAAITLLAPALLATVSINENYWLRPFWALLLCPVNPWGGYSTEGLHPSISSHADRVEKVLFSVSNLVISDSFPSNVQSLAGGIFSVVAQFGNSVGLAVTAAIAASVTKHAAADASVVTSQMEGYRAAFWTVFASTGAVLVITLCGFRKVGVLG
ncbi:hypothetical protein N0V93_000967 [Gnomoniopsis smithogilvyi]|uniref:Major facilitator superfamily (MFS) profile domain-containing protein n=1 Tax=Gnomoniopsis smithogilvyi TaxID=1191159 RepID=A0A9W8Z365_9PEZI|nr:hypothetical protein N0V93_000967 [Gnomoniopsis smithogilvyi]